MVVMDMGNESAVLPPNNTLPSLSYDRDSSTEKMFLNE